MCPYVGKEAMRLRLRRLVVLMLALMLAGVQALADEKTAVTIDGTPVSLAEARVYVCAAKSGYEDIVAYYRDFLGLDYWSIPCSDGRSAAEAVKSDVFRELVMMNVFCQMAQGDGMTATADDEAAAESDAHEFFTSLTDAESAGFTEADVKAVFLKQKLADRKCSRLLNEMDVDEAAVRAAVNPGDYVIYDLCYLSHPLAGVDENGETVPLTEAREREIGRTMLDCMCADSPQEAAAAHPELTWGEASLTAGSREVDQTLLDTVQTMTVGETSGVIKTDYGLFVVRLLDNTDTLAYEDAVAQALYQARADAFSETYNRLYEQTECEINESFWDELTLD